MKRIVAACCAGAAVMLGMGGQAAAAPQPVGEAPVGVLVDARPCNTGEVPKQIRLVLGPGAVICYGGTVGRMVVDRVLARGVASGGYTVCVGGGARSDCLYPNEFRSLNYYITSIEIKPGDWLARQSQNPIGRVSAI